MAQRCATIYCEIHKENEVILFCKYHKSYACLKCMTKGLHKENFCDLTEKEDKPEETFERDNETPTDIIAKRKNQRDEFCTQYDTIKATILQNIKDEHTKVCHRINTMYDDMIKEVDAKFAERERELEEEKVLLENLESEMNQVLQNTSLDKQDAPNSSISTYNEKLKTIENALNGRFELRHRETEPECTYVTSKEIKDIISEKCSVGSIFFSSDTNYGSVDIPVRHSSTESQTPSNVQAFRIVTCNPTEDPFESDSHKSLIKKWEGGNRKKTKKSAKFAAEDNEPDAEHIYEDITIRKAIPTSDITITAGLEKVKGHPTACTFTKIRPLDELRFVILDERHSAVVIMQYEGIIIDQICYQTYGLEMCTMSGFLIAVLSNQDKGFVIEIFEANDKLIKKSVINIDAFFDTRVIGFDYYPKSDKFAISTQDELHVLLEPNKKVKTLSFGKRKPNAFRENTDGEIRRVHDFERDNQIVFDINRKAETITCIKVDKQKQIWIRNIETKLNVGMCLSNQRIYIPINDKVKVIHAAPGTDSKSVDVKGENLAVGVDETNKLLIVTKLSSNPEESRKIQLILMKEEMPSIVRY